MHGETFMHANNQTRRTVCIQTTPHFAPCLTKSFDCHLSSHLLFSSTSFWREMDRVRDLQSSPLEWWCSLGCAASGCSCARAGCDLYKNAAVDFFVILVSRQFVDYQTFENPVLCSLLPIKSNVLCFLRRDEFEVESQTLQNSNMLILMSLNANS